MSRASDAHHSVIIQLINKRASSVLVLVRLQPVTFTNFSAYFTAGAAHYIVICECVFKLSGCVTSDCTVHFVSFLGFIVSTRPLLSADTDTNTEIDSNTDVIHSPTQTNRRTDKQTQR